MLRIYYTRHITSISSQITRLFPFILLLFILFSMNRVIFYSLFVDTTHGGNSLTKILQGYLLGMRYDSATIMYGLSIPILLFYIGLAIPFKMYLVFCRLFSRIWLTIIICFFAFIFVVDIYFFEFYHDHLNIIFFDIFEDDTQAVLNSIWENYPLIPILIGIIAVGLSIYYLLGKVFHQPKHISINPLKNSGILLGSFIVFGIMARASFGLFPINMMSAAYTDDAFLNKLAPNPVFTFEKAVEARLAQKSSLPFWRLNQYKDDIQSAFSKSGKYFLGLDELYNGHHSDSLTEYFSRKTKINNKLSVNPPHIVVVLMEGFGSWILDHESEKFQISCGVSDWIEKSIYFDHFIQSGYSSIQNLAATILSLPSIPGRVPFTQRKYGIIPFESAFAEKYRQKGYETTFVYGGKLSWQRIGDFIPHQGFDHVYGEGDFDYNTPKTDWGVYDEYLFQFVYDILINSNTPQFILFFTTTNHPPYELPSSFDAPSLYMSESLKSVIRGNENLAQKRFAAYQYASCQLNEFLNDLYNEPLLKNTITAVTADHNLQGIRNYIEQDFMHRLRIPLFILGPSNIVRTPRTITAFGTHVDIAPTLLELTLPNTFYLSFGKNLILSRKDLSIANQIGIIFSPKHILNYDYHTRQTRGFYYWDSPKRWKMISNNNTGEEEKLLNYMTAYYSVASFYLEDEWNKNSSFLTIKKEKN